MTRRTVRSWLMAGTAALLLGGGGPVWASCGDGTLDGGEACDAGGANGSPGSCCAADCSFEPSSKVCRPAVSYCDLDETCTGSADACPPDVLQAAGYECGLTNGCNVSNFCDGVTTVCPPSTKLPDTDGDSVTSFNELCDHDDPCTNIGGARGFVAAQPIVYYTRATSTQLNVTFSLPSSTSFADVDPEARGMLLSLWDPPSYDHFSVGGASPGTYAGTGTRGWRRASPRKWLYRDKTATPIWKKITIADRSGPDRPGWVTVKAKASSGYPFPVSPFHFAVTLGSFAVDGAAGRCGETIFDASECPARLPWYSRCSK
jgi:Disintegrin